MDMRGQLVTTVGTLVGGIAGALAGAVIAYQAANPGTSGDVEEGVFALFWGFLGAIVVGVAASVLVIYAALRICRCTRPVATALLALVLVPLGGWMAVTIDGATGIGLPMFLLVFPLAPMAARWLATAGDRAVARRAQDPAG